MWIKRDISKIIESNKDVIQIVRGPRQCGKSSLILKLDPEFKELSLDDPSLRELAENDPELFLKQFDSQKLFIDEAQYAPNLFPSLKRKADLYKRQMEEEARTVIRLSGSNQILMDRYVKESLSGRVSFFDMNTLSVAEIKASQSKSVQTILYMGGWPELHANSSKDPKKFLDDYINSYIEKDIVLAAGIQKSRDFLQFIKLLAGRVGQQLNFSDMGNSLGVDIKTIKNWLSVLEKMNIIYLVRPYSSNLSSRLVKSPKIYFIDTGLACRLQGWTSPEPIMTSPQQGPLFENLVFSEIFKTIQNFQLGWEIFYWRSKDGEEIDFLIQKNVNDYLFVESKVTANSTLNMDHFPLVRKVFAKKIPHTIICHQEGEHVLGQKVPIAHLRNFLLQN